MAEKGMSAIIQDIEDHIAGHGGIPGEWYVSVTDAPKHTLFKVHQLKPSGEAWISRKATSELQAIEVSEYFRTVQKTRGTQVEASVGRVFVYAYKMKPHTKP
ncbi:MAG TPA: hypothetical protein HPQ04_10350 [Rhodospirillaceae bacterium]|nr:hypothetical protein [Rhodospirillaceae bacterium]